MKTMNDSETTAKNIVDQARREATLKIRESEAEAKRILADAQDKAKIAKDNSDRYEQQLREQGQNTLATIKRTIQEAEAYRDSLLHQLQHAAEDILTRSQLLKSKVDTNPYSDNLPDEVLDTASPPTTATQPTTTEQSS
ncbi:MAG: V-type ATPase subunit subunit G family protein [Bacteroidota bacterium]